MAKLPLLPPVDALSAVPAEYHTLPAGALVARIYARGGRHPSSSGDFRYAGPVAGARFDHHIDGGHPGVFYGALSLTTCVAEVFQNSRVLDRTAEDRCVAAFWTVRVLHLLDLTGAWPTRAGASQAVASGPRPRARAWARAIYDAYPNVEGLWYRSSMHGGHHALVLFERAIDALPAEPAIDLPLSHPGLVPDLVRAADELGYLIR